MTVDESIPASEQCPSRVAGKQRTNPYPQKSLTEVADIGDITVADMWGPAHVKGINGELYLTVYTDVKTCYRYRYFSRDKTLGWK
ncbi:hypothetical protein L227DRAFT_514240 [Lentinus tigrinus ALCF2SS1-6]|uniref:Uncharacterized protein n=1 Tax=Lentinus tigrinus ALCF2SS1-6 TaxID=1328759 RepID=A0A5C2RMF5_9APHY|nr:hypothetical protein L227DRAFT_514240 [Lentinus tigrinus ALCF2SS1-6]